MMNVSNRMDCRMKLAELCVIHTFTSSNAVVKLGPAASGAVFSQGTRMQVNATAEHISSGDGAWIMQKCAKTLGGLCHISFEQTHTVFSFVCPAEPFSAQELTKSDDFEVPRGTWGIAVDDSLIQRRLMTRILAHAGVKESRRIIIGQDPSGALQLGNIVKNILIKDSCCKVLVLVDENLDYSHLDMPNFVLSGSLIMRDVLKNLSSDQESRVFALVRSANDSSEDLALYWERVHGFFPKAPTQRERVLEILAPLWNDRFRTPSEGKLDPSDHFDTSLNGSWNGFVEKNELLQSLKHVDDILENRKLEEIPWNHLWSALHGLKGDLMVVDGYSDLDTATMLITSLRGEETPSNFLATWALIRELVIKVAETL